MNARTEVTGGVGATDSPTYLLQHARGRLQRGDDEKLGIFWRRRHGAGCGPTGAYFSMAPFKGALIAIGLFGEPVTVRLVIAAVLMVSGLYLHLAERHAHEHKHDPLEHTHNHVHDAHHKHWNGPEDAEGEPHSHVHRH
jgi:hypothetical protein